MLTEGYIKLHRSLVEWEWYSDTVTKAVFLHLLITANYENKQWKGQLIKRGQRVVSRGKLSQELNISEQKIRTALKRLISTGEITKSLYAKNTIITVVNYDRYQDSNQISNQQSTSNQPATNHNERKIKKDNKAINNNPPISPQREEWRVLFEEFWSEYPKKKSKGQAEKAFKKLNPNSELVAKMCEALARAKTCIDWQKEGGQYIPYPATWINARGWEDDYSVPERKLKPL